ncbi:MAG TPA: hypothetical protein PKJ46_00980 [Methanoculleus sp.]|nr:hypothetical protein [Methanoculleus sp.]
MAARHPPPVSAADMREVYRRYAADRPGLRGILLPDLLPHDACGASPAPGRIRVLFVAEPPPWAAGPSDCLSPDYPYYYDDRYDAGQKRRSPAALRRTSLLCSASTAGRAARTWRPSPGRDATSSTWSGAPSERTEKRPYRPTSSG